jgi:cyclopropane fatty-acyl-phospholipid synthase-like methyltransferase
MFLFSRLFMHKEDFLSKKISEINKRIDVKNADSILDIGSGSGEILDSLKKRNIPDLTFEAAWNQNGAVCLNKTRLGHKLSDICQECPNKLEGRINEDGSCSTPEEALANWPDILIFNESREN